MVADGLDENGITVNGYVLGCGDLYVLDNDTNLEPLVDKSYVKYCASTPSTPMRGDLVVVVENGNTIVKIYNGTEWKNQTLFTKTSDLVNDSGFITASAIPQDISAFQNDAGYITASALPTNISELENDVGYITSSAIPSNVGAFANDAGYITESAIPSSLGAFYNDVGYLTSVSWGEVLGKPSNLSDFNNDVGFITASAIPQNVSSFVNDVGYITASALPSNVSELNNDSGFITASAVPSNVSEFNNDVGYLSAVSWNDIQNKPAIPSTTNDLTNNSGFITASAIPSNVSSFNNDVGYITASQVPTPSFIQDEDENKIEADLSTHQKTSDFNWYVDGVKGSPDNSFYGASYTPSDPQYNGWVLHVTEGSSMPDAYDFTVNWTSYVNGEWIEDSTMFQGLLPVGETEFTSDGHTARMVYKYEDGKLATEDELPTKTSDLTNDSGFITLAQVPTPSYIEDATGNRISANLSCIYIDDAAWEVTDPSSNKHILEYVGFIQSYHTWECVEPENIKLVLTYANDWELQVYTWQEIGPGGDHDWVLDINGSYNGDSDITTIPYFVNAQTTYNYSAQRPVTKHLHLATKEYVDSLFAQLNARISALENN